MAASPSSSRTSSRDTPCQKSLRVRAPGRTFSSRQIERYSGRAELTGVCRDAPRRAQINIPFSTIIDLARVAAVEAKASAPARAARKAAREAKRETQQKEKARRKLERDGKKIKQEAQRCGEVEPESAQRRKELEAEMEAEKVRRRKELEAEMEAETVRRLKEFDAETIQRPKEAEREKARLDRDRRALERSAKRRT